MKKYLLLAASIVFGGMLLIHAAAPYDQSNQWSVGSTTLGFTLDNDGNFVPNVDAACSLGSSTYEWNNLYLDGTAKIDTLTVDESATVAEDLDVGDDFTVTDDAIIGGMLRFSAYDTATASAGVSILPTSSFVILDSTGGAITMTATPVFSTTTVSAGAYMLVSSTDQVITISSDAFATALVRMPALRANIGPGTMYGFLFDGTYWILVSSQNSGFVY